MIIFKMRRFETTTSCRFTLKTVHRVCYTPVRSDFRIYDIL